MRELSTNDDVHDAVRRFLRRGIRKALLLLKEEPLTDEAIHDVRRKLKKLRAVLRLARSGLGHARFRRINICLREAGLPLSELRDAKVLVSTWRTVCRRSRVGSELRETLLAVFEARLEEARSHVLDSPRIVAEVSDRLRHARKWMSQRPSPKGSWDILQEGLNRAHARGVTALKRATATCSDSTLHELRKRAKDLHNVCVFIANAGTADLGPLVRSTRRLGDLLGEDRDLALLERAMTGPHLARLGARRRIQALASGRRRRLQAEALRLSRTIYSPAMSARLRKYFRG